MTCSDCCEKSYKYPRYSNGEVSFLSQKTAIEGTLKKWQSSEMVEKMFLWAWDARPFPYFPNLCDMWTDCHNWQTGHWIQGKISQLNVSDVLSDLLQKVGLKGDQFDTNDVKGLLSGYVINDQQPVRSIIKMLRRCYFFDVVEQNSKLKFIQKGRGVKTEIPIGEMVTYFAVEIDTFRLVALALLKQFTGHEGGIYIDFDSLKAIDSHIGKDITIPEGILLGQVTVYANKETGKIIKTDLNNDLIAVSCSRIAINILSKYKSEILSQEKMCYELAGRLSNLAKEEKSRFFAIYKELGEKQLL